VAAPERPLAGTENRQEWIPSLDVAYTFQSRAKKAVQSRLNGVVTGDGILAKVRSQWIPSLDVAYTFQSRAKKAVQSRLNGVVTGDGGHRCVAGEAGGHTPRPRLSGGVGALGHTDGFRAGGVCTSPWLACPCGVDERGF
jgi:hypothetical protein